MSGLAEILLKKNFEVSGSDVKVSPATDKLKSMGAKIYIGQTAENITLDIDLVVYTAAISKDNEELLKAKDLKIPLMSRAEFLGNIMKGHKYNVAVSGAHGKTTTTSMLSSITLKANLDPTILVGGNLDIINGNVRTGDSPYFITEACEYKGSFLKFFPFIGVILNIDAEHLDYYKNIENVQNAFLKFAKLIPKNGYLVCYSDDNRINNIMPDVDCNIITYGINSGRITAKDIHFDEVGCACFKVYKDNKKLSTENIKSALESFKGTHRRFEIKSKKNGITVVDDYAHHPTEIRATLNTAQNYPHKRIICVFQPHTFSRTINLYKEFTSAFDNVDELILTDIFPAREKDTGKVSSAMLARDISKRGVKCSYIKSFNSIVEYLKRDLKDGDLFLTIGAGDVYKIGEMYLQ